MKKTILLFSVIAIVFISFIKADEKFSLKKHNSNSTQVKEHFGYINMGVGPLPLPFPNFGFGYRGQHNHLGGDLAVDLATIHYITMVKATPSILYFPQPNSQSQFYSGLGIGAAVFFRTNNNTYYWMSETVLGFSPEFIFGKKYKNDSGSNRFFEVRVGLPTYLTDTAPKRSSHWMAFPLVNIKYGISY